jgi:hypothetical protein
LKAYEVTNFLYVLRDDTDQSAGVGHANMPIVIEAVDINKYLC